MKNFGLLIIGILVGAGGMYFYNQQVAAPQIAAEATQVAKSAIEADAKAQAATLSGTVVATAKDSLTITTADDQGQTKQFTITTDSKTKIVMMNNDQNATQKAVGLNEIIPGSFVTVKTSAAVGENTTIYATEIIKL